MAIKEQEKHKNYRRHRKETEKEQTRVLPVIILSVSGLKHSNKSGGGEDQAGRVGISWAHLFPQIYLNLRLHKQKLSLRMN